MGLLKDIFGSRVKVPALKDINLDAEIEKAFKSVQEQLPEAKRTARSLGEADADTALAVLERFSPGTRDVLAQQMKNLQSGLRGELPSDVQRQIADRAAARSVAGGFGGTVAARNLELRDLGLTSLQRMDAAMQQANQSLLTFRNLGAQAPSTSSMFLTPQQRLSFLQQERNTRYNRELAAAQAKAAPSPVARGLFDFASTVGGAAIGAFAGGSSVPPVTPTSAAPTFSGPKPGLSAPSNFRVTPESFVYGG